jgi:hypothetical protein
LTAPLKVALFMLDTEDASGNNEEWSSSRAVKSTWMRQEYQGSDGKNT